MKMMMMIMNNYSDDMVSMVTVQVMGLMMIMLVMNDSHTTMLMKTKTKLVQ